MLGWPLVAWWTARTDPVETWWQVGLAVVAGEMCLALLIVVRRRALRGEAAGGTDDPDDRAAAGRACSAAEGVDATPAVAAGR
jgi:hypothetical protein